MISIYETTRYSTSVISLWQESFGDSKEDVLFFLNHCRNKICLCAEKNGELLSMLFLVDCMVNGDAYKYIYAACTSKNARKNGYMSRLLDYCISKYNKVLLIPADEKLVDYYSKRGFTHKTNMNNILFNESDEIKEYLFEGCSLAKPFALANLGE